uniref:Uncharacterized protein n=1 Tax=Anopheles maculatus TaxID=74869 RepID=A0A182SE76_9DIPT
MHPCATVSVGSRTAAKSPYLVIGLFLLAPVLLALCRRSTDDQRCTTRLLICSLVQPACNGRKPAASVRARFSCVYTVSGIFSTFQCICVCTVATVDRDGNDADVRPHHSPVDTGVQRAGSNRNYYPNGAGVRSPIGFDCTRPSCPTR